MKDLRFYNKEGFPYNFTYNEDLDYREGKVYFDENSTDTYKTLCLYTFENIPELTINKALIYHHDEYYNDNGTIFNRGDNVLRSITNITTVNNSPDFYTKWVYGVDFDKYYTKGSWVRLENIQGKYIKPNTGSLNENVAYTHGYVILDTKPNACMIKNIIPNEYGAEFSDFENCTIRSYGYVNYFGEIDIVNQGAFLSNDGVVTIENSENNNGNFKYDTINRYKPFAENYKLPTTQHDDSILNVKLKFMTERPKLLTTSATITTTNSGITNEVTITSSSDIRKFITDEGKITGLHTGTEFYLEDVDDNKLLENALLTVSGYDTHDIVTDQSIKCYRTINKTKTLNAVFNSNKTIKFPSDDIYKFVPDSMKVYDNFIKIYDNVDINVKPNDNFNFMLLNNTFETKYYRNVDKNFTAINVNIANGDTIVQVSESVLDYDKTTDLVDFTKGLDVYDNIIKIYNNTSIDIVKGDQLRFELTSSTNNDLYTVDNITISENNTIIEVSKTITGYDETKYYKISKYINQTTYLTIFTSGLYIYDNIIKIYNNVNLDIKIGQKISFESTPTYITNFYKNNNTKYTISNITISENNTIIEVSENIDDDKLNYYDIYKYIDDFTVNITLKSIYTIHCTLSKYITINDIIHGENVIVAYHPSNQFTLQQEIVRDDNDNYDWENTIQHLNSSYSDLLDYYNVFVTYNNDGTNSFMDIINPYDMVGYMEVISVDELYLLDDSTVTVDITKTTGYSLNYSALIFDEHSTYTEKALSNNDKLSKNYETYIQFELGNDLYNNGIYIEVNNRNYSTKFDTDTEQTLTNFISEHSTLLAKEGFNITLEDTDILKFKGRFPSIGIYHILIDVNTYSKYTIFDKRLIPNSGLFLTATRLEVENYSLISDGLAQNMILEFRGLNVFGNKEYTILKAAEDSIYLSYQGYMRNTIHETVYKYKDINLTEIESEISTIDTREYLRKPRYNNYKDIKYRFRWTSDVDKDIFFYDFSGEQEVLSEGPIIDNLRHTELIYTGIKPLNEEGSQVYLNKTPNLNVNEVNNPEVQQTIFEELLYDTEKMNSGINNVPEPIQAFMGLKSDDEGYSFRNMILEEFVDNKLTFEVKKDNTSYFRCKATDVATYIDLSDGSDSFNLFDEGFSTDYKIRISITNTTRINAKVTTFKNYEDYTISSVSNRRLNLKSSTFENKFYDFNTDDYIDTETFSITIKLLPKTILDLKIYAESEIEDIRFKTNVRNLGLRLDEDDVMIFKESDIEEHGIDYKLLNKKRKELLMIYPEIYNYIGSYKALINAINFFGYNDLEINEYYKHIKMDSPLYEKLKRVTIKKMFDNDFEGWVDNEIINKEYLYKTNLFNLTYNITDEYGNNVSMYSNDEVMIKLNGLKKWLERNVMPLETDFLDITGVSTVRNEKFINNNTGYNVIKYVGQYNAAAINFHYTETKNFDNNFLFSFDFYTNNGSIPTNGWECKIRTYSEDSEGKLIEKQRFTTFKTDLESFSFSYNKNVDPFIYIETSYFNEYGLCVISKNLTNTIFSKDFHLVNNNMKMYNYSNPEAYSPATTGDYGYVDLQNGYYYYVDEYGHYYVKYDNI